MEASDATKRIDIGFQSGQALVLYVKDAAYRELLDALKSGNGSWHEVETFDSAVTVDLRQVIYVRRAIEQQRVGF